jgi:hypothetical protein
MTLIEDEAQRKNLCCVKFGCDWGTYIVKVPGAIWTEGIQVIRSRYGGSNWSCSIWTEKGLVCLDPARGSRVGSMFLSSPHDYGHGPAL